VREIKEWGESDLFGKMKTYEIEITFKRKLKKSDIEEVVYNMADLLPKSAKITEVRIK